MDLGCGEGEPLKRRGLSKTALNADKEVWLWSCQRNATKQQIMDYARMVFFEVGIKNFKASDGWYRRWKKRWKPIKCSDPISPQVTSKSLNKTVQKANTSLTDCQPSSTTVKDSDLSSNCNLKVPKTDSSDDKTTKETDICRDSTRTTMVLEDCFTPTQRLELPLVQSSTNTKKKGDRYLPHFKTKVVTFAIENSIKDAASTFNVNKGTISDWIRESSCFQPSMVLNKTAEQLVEEFVNWLKDNREQTLQVNRKLIKDKLKTLLSNYQHVDPKQSNSWLLQYYDRFNHPTEVSKNHIMYGTSFKQEVVLYARALSKKSASEIFNISRKRIIAWTQMDFSKKAEKDYGNHLTDKSVDLAVWKWFQNQSPPPSGPEVQRKGRELYRAAGYHHILCTPGWYHKWRCRFSIPSHSSKRSTAELLLLSWLLEQADKNISVSHAQLLKRAQQIDSLRIKIAPSWGIRFLKKHSKTLDGIYEGEFPLPPELTKRADSFVSSVGQFMNTHEVLLKNFISFDEIPLSFSPSESVKKGRLLRKSPFDHCAASLILACSADGQLLPTTLILKGSEKSSFESSVENIFTVVQPNAVSDESTMALWINNVLLRRLGSPEEVVILMCDAFEPHVTLNQSHAKIFQENNIHLFVIPSGTGLKLQPINFSLSKKFTNEIDNFWTKWQHDNSSTSGGVKFPKHKDLLQWVELTHSKLSFQQKEEIQNSFRRTGFLSDNPV